MPGLQQAILNYGRGAISALGHSSGARTLLGAGLGAAYGAMSDRTSIAGGALMGAAAGRYGYAGLRRGLYYNRRLTGFNTAMHAAGRYGSMVGIFGRGAGIASNMAFGAGQYMRRDAARAGFRIGATAKRAMNGFRAFRPGFAGWRRGM